MAFGCGIGDIIQVAKLLTRTITSIRNAPANFQEAAETVTSLDLLFETLSIEVEKPESVFTRDPAQGERLAILNQSCASSLNKLLDLLDRHASLGTANVKVLDRLRFSKKEVESVQRELQMRYSNLSTFLETLGIGGVGRIEYKVDGLQAQQEKILKAIDHIVNVRLETGSVLSTYSNDDKTVWRQLRRDLNTAGFKSSDLEKHKHLIYQKLVELQTSGMLEWQGAGGAIEDDVQSVRSTATVKFIAHTKRNYRPPTAETVVGSDDEEDQHYSWRPGTTGALFEESDEDEPFNRTGVQQERTAAKAEKLPAYQDAVSSPRLRIPVPIPQRTSYSAGNSPRTNPSSYQQPFLASSPRLAAGIPRSPQQYGTSPSQFGMSPFQFGTSPRRSAETIPQNLRPNPDSFEIRRSSRASLLDDEIRSGKRTTATIIWRYRRPADIQRPPMQSADLGDGTLPKAASEGRTEDVQRLLLAGHNIESTGERAVAETPAFESTTSLFRAARNGHFETAHLLLRYGASPNPTRKDGKNLLRLLATSDSTELVRLLLEYNASPLNTGALPQAALAGNLPTVQLLLSYGADVNEVAKQPALYRAAAQGYSDIVDLLLREGADVSWVSSDGPSALYKAVEHGHYKIVRALLSYGARPDIGCGPDGETALFTACAIGHEPTVRLLLQRGAKASATWYRRYTPPLQKRDGGIEEFFQDAPLLAAARGGRLSIAKLLLEYGADVNLRSHFGQTAVDTAYEKGYMALVDTLCAAGARVSEGMLKQRDAYERKKERAEKGWKEEYGRDVDGRPKSRGSSTVASRPKASSRSSNVKAAAAGALLLDGLMLLGGG